jgi:hypothetical protein
MTAADEQLNWVEKRLAREKQLLDSKPRLWKDVCDAMTDASRSFNQKCGGNYEAVPTNGHRFRVFGGTRQVDVDFDQQACKITASYGASPFGSKFFTVQADHNSAFITEDGKKLTPDEVSERILGKFFFPD